MANERRGPYVSSGLATGTGALITVVCGFRPSYIRLFNITKKTTADWVPAEGDGKCFVDNDTGSGTEDMSEVTSNGISSIFNGFTIGTSALLNNTSDVIYWAAFRS